MNLVKKQNNEVYVSLFCFPKVSKKSINALTQNDCIIFYVDDFVQ